MRLSLIYPSIGHARDRSHLRSWQMEPLPMAALAGLTPPEVELRFHDDRMETIPYDEPTDAVAISVETYTARRAYQIAGQFRRRGVPVILGGFHPSLVPEEAERFGEAIILGEAESLWAEVIDDLAHGTLKRRYEGRRGPLAGLRIDRSIFAGKRYLPIGLVETGRGCRFPCEFCAVQSFFDRTYRSRPGEDVLRELAALRGKKKLFFFVDDNFAGDMEQTREWLSELAAMKLRWVTQMSIHAAHDEDFVAAISRAGCRGVLIGFESLEEKNLDSMQKRFNRMGAGFPAALANLRRHRIGVYGTFVFGYDHDRPESFDEAVDFALTQGMYLAGFNHLMPFPGTPLYRRLEAEKRLRRPPWWLDSDYRYNQVPFHPRVMTAEALHDACLRARQRFYSWSNILRRLFRQHNDAFMWRNFLPLNAMHHWEVGQRDGYPLGDVLDTAPLLETARVSAPFPSEIRVRG
jgi:radical SAM superfamily enzyme YgiQ (UPF0313 family)